MYRTFPAEHAPAPMLPMAFSPQRYSAVIDTTDTTDTTGTTDTIDALHHKQLGTSTCGAVEVEALA